MEGNGIKWLIGSTLRDLDYADDLALVDEDMEATSRMTEKLAAEARKVGLEMNKNKTKILKVQNDNVNPKEIEGEKLQCLEHFTYLGSTLCSDGDVRRVMKTRLGKAAAVFARMN